jgi:hypothetical protein
MIFIKALILILVVYLVLIYFPMITYLSARLSGIKIHAGKLLKYRMKKIPIGMLVRNQIKLKTNGFDLELSQLVELYQEGVDFLYQLVALPFLGHSPSGVGLSVPSPHCAAGFPLLSLMRGPYGLFILSNSGTI